MEKDKALSTFNINQASCDVASSISNENVPSFPESSSIIVNQPFMPVPHPDVPSSSTAFVGKARPPRKIRAKEMEKTSEEYLSRRQRNNVAVKKSREKKREKSECTLQKVEQLKAENEQLEAKISTLTKELCVLKDLFMDHARGFCAGGNANLLTPNQLHAALGCKVIGSESEPCTSSQSVPGSSRQNNAALSFIEPLINAAEMELMSLKKDENDNVTMNGTNSAAYNDPVGSTVADYVELNQSENQS